MAALVGQLLSGSGLRLSEALTSRVKDVDLEGGELVIRRGKGEGSGGAGWVELPEVLGAQVSRCGPLLGLAVGVSSQAEVSRSGDGPGAEASLHASAMQRAMAEAVRASGIGKRVTSLPCGTVLRPISWRRATIFGRCRNRWGIWTFPRP